MGSTKIIRRGLMAVAIAGSVFSCDLAMRGKVKVNDTIYHPLYGSYPAVIPMKQGMTLYPGQSAWFDSGTLHPKIDPQAIVGAPELGECHTPGGCVYPETEAAWRERCTWRATKDGPIYIRQECDREDAERLKRQETKGNKQ